MSRWLGSLFPARPRVSPEQARQLQHEGGSILTVPALVYLLGQSSHRAVTASLLVVGIAAVTGAIAHARAGRVELRTGAQIRSG